MEAQIIMYIDQLLKHDFRIKKLENENIELEDRLKKLENKNIDLESEVNIGQFPCIEMNSRLYRVKNSNSKEILDKWGSIETIREKVVLMMVLFYPKFCRNSSIRIKNLDEKSALGNYYNNGVIYISKKNTESKIRLTAEHTHLMELYIKQTDSDFFFESDDKLRRAVNRWSAKYLGYQISMSIFSKNISTEFVRIC